MKASASVSTLSGTKAPRILVIDDDEGVRKVAERSLLYKGFDASSVSSGEEGISLVQREKFACIVLDLTMPTLSGRDTFLALRALNAELPILLASGGRTAEVDGLLTEHARASFIAKPFTPAQLALAVEQACGNSAA